jgi:hypothetical protein
VALFEDVAERPWSAFLAPTTYYRPLFHITLSMLWHGSASVDAALASVRFLHMVPLTLLVVLLVVHMRPRSAVDAAAATVAVAVVIGAPGVLGNLELPLSYTIVGMPLAVLTWIVLERERRRWHGAAIVVLLLAAVGFKEQGLIIAPVILVAWWTGAPGIGRGTAIIVAVFSVTYVGWRLALRDGSGPMFEQDIGFGFGGLSAGDAAERFGAFPYTIYAYNGASTMANVLFAEPTDGVFRILRAQTHGEFQPWHIVYLFSSIALTMMVAWWGIGTLRRSDLATWSPEARLFVALVVAIAASGALSFNYSRDRLGGMAVPFYALCGYGAIRAFASRAVQGSRLTGAVAVLVLVLLAAAWQLRALYTLEFTRQRAVNAHREWLTDVGHRKVEFAGRAAYLRIMQEMREQGSASNPPQRTRYPRWIIRLLGEY